MRYKSIYGEAGSRVLARPADMRQNALTGMFKEYPA
jgi:hypothetical protein